MPDRCGYCETTRPIGGTEIVIVSGLQKEAVWVEFCSNCADKWVFTNAENGIKMTVRELKNRAVAYGTEVTRDVDEVDELQKQLYGDSA